jgi:DNA-binding protein HU-beta
MNKQELIDAIAKDTGLSKAECGRVLESVLANVVKGIKSGTVTLIGFGTFKKVSRKARTGVNPQTGAKLQIPAKNVVKFAAGKKLKEDIR